MQDGYTAIEARGSLRTNGLSSSQSAYVLYHLVYWSFDEMGQQATTPLTTAMRRP